MHIASLFFDKTSARRSSGPPLLELHRHATTKLLNDLDGKILSIVIALLTSN